MSFEKHWKRDKRSLFTYCRKIEADIAAKRTEITCKYCKASAVLYRPRLPFKKEVIPKLGV